MPTLRNAFRKRLGAYKKNLPPFAAFMGDAAGNVAVPGREHYVYVRTTNGDLFPRGVFNDRLPLDWNKPVWVGYTELNTQSLRVLAPRDVYADPTPTGLIEHAPKHEFGGSDPVNVWSGAIMPWRVAPIGGLIVRVFSVPFLYGGVYQNPPKYVDVDLAPYLPTRSGTKWVMVCAGSATAGKFVSILDGEVYPVRHPKNLEALPDLPDDGFAVAAITLSLGQTALALNKNSSDFIDLRFSFGGSGSGGGTGAGKYEPYLGKPSESGSYLASTAEGVRSWVTVNKPDASWEEYSFTYDNFSFDRVSKVGNIINATPSSGDEVMLNESEKPILSWLGGAGIYYWKKTSVTYKTVVKDVTTASKIVGAINIDISSGMKTYSNAYIIAIFRAGVTATHTFSFHLRGGIRVWFDDTQVVNSWAPADETAERDVTYNANLTSGQQFLIRIEFYNKTTSPLLHATVDTTVSSYTLGGAEARYTSSGSGVTMVDESVELFNLPMGYWYKSIPVEMVLSGTSPDGSSIVWEFRHGGSGFFPVINGQTILMNGEEGYQWRYKLATDFGDYAPVVNSLGLHIGEHLPESGSGIVKTIIAGDHISVDNTDPEYPVVAADVDGVFVPLSQQTDTKDPTGWLNGALIGVAYDSSARKITLTGTLEYYWRGVKHTLSSPWLSPAHPNSIDKWFLYSSDGTNFTWSSTPWTFDLLMAAFTNFSSADKFGIREVHGLMPWDVHREFHKAFGTYRASGGTLTWPSTIPSDTTAANRRPDVAATYIEDEDSETVLAALTSKLYTKLYLSGTETLNYVLETAEIIRLSGARPYYNEWNGSAWAETLMTANTYTCVWLMAIPVTDDAASQKYRYVWIQGQSAGSLAAQQGLVPSDLRLGTLAADITEYVFLTKIIINYQSAGGGNWVITSVTDLYGSKFQQVGQSGGTFLSSVSTDATLTGNGTPASPLSVVSTQPVKNHGQAVFSVEGIVSGAGSKPLRVYVPYVGSGATIEEVYLAAGTAPSSNALRIDVNKNGTSIFNATQYVELSIGSNTATKSTDFSSTTLAKDDYLTIEVVQGDAAVADVSIHVRYKWTPTGV